MDISEYLQALTAALPPGKKLSIVFSNGTMNTE
jgi:hypothetical protein